MVGQREIWKVGSKVAPTAVQRVAVTAGLMGHLWGSQQAALSAERWAEKKAERWDMSAARSADWLVIQKAGQKDETWWEQRSGASLSTASRLANTLGAKAPKLAPWLVVYLVEKSAAVTAET